MKIKSHLLIVALLGISFISAPAQPRARGGGMGGPPKGPDLGGAMSKLFGDNSAFSANMEFQVKEGDDTITMPGKIAFDQGKSRFEMDMTLMRGSKMSPSDVQQMKSMGMGSMIMITRPDKKTSYRIYPGMSAYTEEATKDAEAPEAVSKYKSESTELGKETVDGHACIKNKVIVTDDKGVKHESTVWNATDLKQFPVKIETTEQGQATTMSFRNVKLAKPDASVFTPPADFKQYPDMMSMMQQEMMKRMSEGNMPPPGR